MRARWRHLANTIELVLTSAHPSSQPKLQIDRFSRFRSANGRVSSGQLAPPGEHDWTCAHWRHLTNTVGLVLPSAHQSPQPKRQDDRLTRFCTARGKMSLYFTTDACFPQNWPFLLGDLFLWTIPTHNTNGIFIGSAVFAQTSVECPYTLPWDAHSPPEICPFPWGI